MLKLYSTTIGLLVLCGAMTPIATLHAKEKLPAEQVSAGTSAAETRLQLNARLETASETTASKSELSRNPQPTPALPEGEQATTTPSSNALPETPQEQFAFPASHHPWAKFPIGSWREIEIVTETFDESGKVYGRSVTTQKEVLKALADDSYVLDIQATVNVSGKQIVGPVNTRILRLLTDQSGVVFSTTRSDDETILLDDQSFKCQVWDVLYGEETRNLRDRLYYSSELFPHILRRETFEVTEHLPVETLPTDISSVVARNIPLPVDNQIIPCVCEKTTRLRDKGGIQIIRMVSPSVPGGEVQSWSTDFNAKSEPNRWSVQKLLKFEVNTTGADHVESK
ncbi:hypothetical protein [Bythopirellula polymerisocia]|uniref:SLA1 homology domain-containing protein n=1 Tax=Bythopirellula polymerisocia TaxID=2528003 RepID=A0A5C6CJC6_9BACT|nr:hypothetical protein [Bythopirellula polymerisocia]TWU24660.1 hypothetical protein Pla144_35460 [Bythopirellula polymerisocia]